MLSKRFRLLLALVLTLGFMTGCNLSSPATPAPQVSTALPAVPTSLPPTATLAAPSQAPTTAVPATAAPTQAAGSKTWQTTDAGRIKFNTGDTSWYTQGDLNPNTAISAVLGASKGQQMSIWLTTEPASNDASLATLHITDAKGQALTSKATQYWSSILSATQDYHIEVRSLAQKSFNYTLVIEIPAATIDPAAGDLYEPVSPEVCKIIQESANQALRADFYVQHPAPFLDTLGGEAGQGCRLTFAGDGTQFKSPQAAVQALVAGMGWDALPSYQADGPTGSASAVVRDMALMLISANWKPAVGATCPKDQPISACKLTDAQKSYLIRIDVAQYKATFSLDGHWVDEATGFTLDLGQEWKNIYGGHQVVANGGKKIDALDASISGTLKGKVVEVQFKSSFTSKTGVAQLTYVDVSTMQWKIVTPPSGEYYLPAQATLKRK